MRFSILFLLSIDIGFSSWALDSTPLVQSDPNSQTLSPLKQAHATLDSSNSNSLDSSSNTKNTDRTLEIHQIEANLKEIFELVSASKENFANSLASSDSPQNSHKSISNPENPHPSFYNIKSFSTQPPSHIFFANDFCFFHYNTISYFKDYSTCRRIQQIPKFDNKVIHSINNGEKPNSNNAASSVNTLKITLNSIKALQEKNHIHKSNEHKNPTVNGIINSDSIAKNQKSTSDSSSVQENESAPSENIDSSHIHPNLKTPLKDRFNYASVDCGSVILNSNKESKKAKSILSNTKDSYMLNICSAKNKFVVVELCQDILIDTIVIANYEFFSSTFKSIELSVSDRYPPKDKNWVSLGIFHAKNSRSDQVFKIPKPKLWAKYARLDILTHHGSQFYCPISKFAVYGTTQIEKFRHEAEQEELSNKKNKNIPAKIKKKPNKRINGEFASTLYSYISDFEKVVLGINPGQIPKNDNPIGFPTAHSLGWLTSNTLLNEHINADPTKVFIPLSQNQHTNTAILSDLVNKITKLNNENDITTSVGSLDTRDESCHKPDHILDPDEIIPPNSSPSPTTETLEPSRPIENRNNLQHSDKDSISFIDTKIRNTNANSEAAIKDSLIEEASSQENSDNHNSDSANHILNDYDSVYKKITNRLVYLEQNLTQILTYFDDQTEIFNQILTKVHLSNLDHLNKAVRHLNTSTTKQIHALIDISEEIWRTILFDVESYRQSNNDRFEDLNKRIDTLASENEFDTLSTDSEFEDEPKGNPEIEIKLENNKLLENLEDVENKEILLEEIAPIFEKHNSI
ncbi:hypothetical protein AYI70_g25 [Smittium culicis]|uniref:SUN domain-containing protein n=1 Tax=Smittium culicis TaxID=133412 RepID=A0A1R1YI54_9FUNG|nr:hypothetical protein AYI70_g25 [Smittium culicis]